MMAEDRADEFYVGYVDRAPAGLARFVRRVVGALAILVAATFALVAATQDELPTGVFEFGVEREVRGVLYADPLPYLRIVRPTDAVGPAAASHLLLVGPGKRGMPDAYREHHGLAVAFRGSLIYRENLAMIEMNAPESFRVLGPPGPGEGRPRSGAVAEVELVGELVDTKCWLGVMRPATGKVHRACAARCLAGGVPPGLLVRDREGSATVFMLVGEDGGVLGVDPGLAARSFTVRGLLELADEIPVVRVATMELH